MAEDLSQLPPSIPLETPVVLKKAARAHRFLAELKGRCRAIPNQGILISTLALQEAKYSSEIENIVTTQDELFREDLEASPVAGLAAKEVRNYAQALRTGFKLVRDRGLLTANDLVRVQEELERNRAGFRRLPGTNLVNDRTGEVVYTPPQDYDTIVALMANLERFINDDSLLDADPLVKMAVLHYQFESIHPFYDGNGRTGRILNVLYLVLKGLLDIPVLYLSRHFIRSKEQYYQGLREIREAGAWESWLLYVLDAVETTSRGTLAMVDAISTAIEDYRLRIKEGHRFFSQELVDNLFFHPYTKIEFVERELGVSRLTATKYLDALADSGFVRKEKAGRFNYYINPRLVGILTEPRAE